METLTCTACHSLLQRCTFCGACRHERHSEECKDAWRKTILSYKSGMRK